MIILILTNIALTYTFNSNCSINTTSNIERADSGKFINDLGDFNNCQKHSQFYHFLTLAILNSKLGFMYQGFCLPVQCTASEMNAKYSQNLTISFNKTMNKILVQQGFEQMDIIKSALFVNPQSMESKIGTGNIIVIAILSCLFLFTLIGGGISLFGIAKKNAFGRVIRCFSIYDNFKKIMNTSQPQNSNLTFLNGIRVISICWIIFGHDQWIRIMNITNWIQLIDILQSIGIPSLVPAAYFGVDTFFWVGGFLVCLGLLDQIKKIKNLTFLNLLKKYPLMLIHRFIRIWPTYMVALFVFWQILPIIGSGPIYPFVQYTTNTCNNGRFLWNMFFLDNFQDHGASGTNYCFGWGWYLANDFQFFIFTPFLIFLFIKRKKIGLLVTCLLIVASVITAWVMVYVNDWRYPFYNPALPPQPSFMDKFYYRPYIRVPPYLMGLISGYLYSEWKDNNQTIVYWIDKMKNSVIVRIILYIFGAGMTTLVIWIVTPVQTESQVWGSVAQSFYNSLNRIFFVLGVMAVTLPCMFGCKNDPCYIFLGSRLWYSLARVSFCMYLVHLIVVLHYTFNARNDLYWQQFSSLYVIYTDILMTVIVALGLSLLIEVIKNNQAPILNLEKLLFRREKKAPVKQKLLDQKQKSIQNEGQVCLVNQIRNGQTNEQGSMQIKINGAIKSEQL